MHLPDEYFGGRGGGDALAAGCREPHRVAFPQRPGALECHVTAREEQMEVRRLRQLESGDQLAGPQNGLHVRRAAGGAMQLGEGLEVPIFRPRKDELVDQLFGFDDEPSPNAVEQYVARLRKKLAGSGAEIRTLRGLGYQIVCQ